MDKEKIKLRIVLGLKIISILILFAFIYGIGKFHGAVLMGTVAVGDESLCNRTNHLYFTEIPGQDYGYCHIGENMNASYMYKLNNLVIHSPKKLNFIDHTFFIIGIGGKLTYG